MNDAKLEGSTLSMICKHSYLLVSNKSLITDSSEEHTLKNNETFTFSFIIYL